MLLIICDIYGLLKKLLKPQFKVRVYPKMNILYSPSCRSKPVRQVQLWNKKIFVLKSKWLWTLKVHSHKTFMVQKVHKGIVKVYPYEFNNEIQVFWRDMIALYNDRYIWINFTNLLKCQSFELIDFQWRDRNISGFIKNILFSSDYGRKCHG